MRIVAYRNSLLFFPYMLILLHELHQVSMIRLLWALRMVVASVVIRLDMVLTMLLVDRGHLLGVMLLLLTQFRPDIVQILHLFAFIVLYKTLIGTQML